MCLEAFFDPSTYNLVTTDRHTPVRVLAFLWARGGPEYRSLALHRIAEYMRQRLPGSEGLLANFADASANADVEKTQSLLVNLRKAWAQSSPAGTVVRDRRLVEATLQGILADDTGTALDDLIELLHGEYSRKREDKYDFELFMTVGRVLTPPFMKVLRERRGDHALYDLLVTLVTDQRVDLEFSFLALITLTEEFGAEGLMLDDRIPRIIFDLPSTALFVGNRSPSYGKLPADGDRKNHRTSRQFEVYKDRQKQYRWRLRGADGEPIAESSSGYNDRADCLARIELVRSESRIAAIVDPTLNNAVKPKPRKRQADR